MVEARILFGKRVKELRRMKRLTQAQLAEITDLSVNYISQIETGEASPSFETMVRLAESLEIEMKELFIFSE